MKFFVFVFFKSNETETYKPEKTYYKNSSKKKYRKTLIFKNFKLLSIILILFQVVQVKFFYLPSMMGLDVQDFWIYFFSFSAFCLALLASSVFLWVSSAIFSQ